jgi:hypothetical protein
MVPHAKLILATAAVIVVAIGATVGWALTTYHPSPVPTPSTPTNSTEQTSTPTIPTTVSPSAFSPVPTQMSPSTSSPTLTSTSEPTPTAISTSFPTSTPTSTPTPTLTPGKSVGNGLELTTSLVKTVYSLGEPINVTLKITNITNQTINFTHTGMDFDFVVYNDTYNTLYQWSSGRVFPLFITVEPLLPGENVSETIVWPQTCNTSPSTNGVSVSPGTYFIVGESNARYGLQTAPTQITILYPSS